MNLQSILYAFIFILTLLNKAFAEKNPELVISQSDVDAQTLCGIGLKFFIELNNTSSNYDYEVQVSADECCLEDDGSLDCDVLDIIGDCVGFIPKGAIKTVRMVAPILDPIERCGYCILYLDSKCNYNGRNMRDTLNINFDTSIGKIDKMLKENIKLCQNIGEDPLNDCQPVDSDSYYNSQKPYYNKKIKRCVKAPSCISKMLSELPSAVYDPISNRCIVGDYINKRDIGYIKRRNSKDRNPKDVIIVKKLEVSSDDNFTSNALNDAVDKVPMCKKCNKLHILDSAGPSQMPKYCYTNFLMNYIKNNKYTVIIFGAVIFVQCCLIVGMIYCFTKSCACCKEKKVVRKFFNYRQDASVTTPLIGTSNICTETDYNFESDSSNANKKIKRYEACQKEKNNNVKMSMSDDILSKCLNRRNWSRQHHNEVIQEANYEAQINVDNVVESRINPPIDRHQPISETKTKTSETKVVFEDDKTITCNKISNKYASIPKCLNKEIIEREKEEIEEYESLEKEIQCLSYSNDICSNVTGFKPSSVVKDLAYFKSETKAESIMTTDKEAEACFPNDSMDDLLIKKGIYNVDNISITTDSNPIKSSTPSSKTSKNNFMKNVLSLMHKTCKKIPSSDPGRSSKENLDVKLIHMSQASIISASNESDCLKLVKSKDSRTSM